ncbi:MAG TPA: hypothetical protein PLO69_11965 [Gammaproteobacteria bacterium]|nr:hypothetical protein [Gammaproteobacteria bacterium]
MKTFLRTLRKVVLWGLAIVVILVATLFVINSRDERLSPQTARLLTARTNPYPANENLYFMLSGLDAPPGGSVIATGEARVQAYEAWLRKASGPSDLPPDKALQGALEFKGTLPWSRQSVGALWHEADGHRLEIERLVTDNRELYRRYRALHTASGYYETATPSIYAMPPFPPSRLRHLFLAYFAVRMKSGVLASQSAALAAVGDDLQVWRKVLLGDGSLISKMVAVAYLRQDFLLLGNMTADPGLRLGALQKTLKLVVNPFPLGDWKIGQAFAHEFRVDARLLRTLYRMTPYANEHISVWAKFLNWVGKPFYRLHATENFDAENAVKFIAIANGPPRKLESAMAAYSNEIDCMGTPKLSCLYNPIGKILSAIAAPAYEQYPLRAYDVAALQRMVRLAYAIRVQKVPMGDIVSFMRRHPDWSTHPVTGVQFNFDQATTRLSVVPTSEQQKHRKLDIPVWHAETFGR